MTNLSGANLNYGAAVGPQGESRDSPSSFPAYPTYRNSGVEWLGVVPEHWALGSLKHLAWIRNGRDYKEVESPDGEYPVLGSGGQFANATRYLYDGESVLLGRKGTIDKPLYIHGRFWTVDTMFYTEVSSGASAKFLYYNALTIPFQYYSTSTALPSMTQGDLLNHPCVIPTFNEQTQIACFLDHETARIDALIEEQQRLIELLKEKRQAVISHAVTKGLDPTVPMKDSGVEWLGEVPAHWDVIRSKFVFRLVSGYAFKSEFFQKNGDGEKVLITPGSFDELGRLYFSEKSTVQYEGEWQAQFELKVGDLVMVLTDLSYKKLILGRAAFVERDDALLNQRIAKVVITPRVEANYLWLGVNSEVMREQLKITASGATVFHTSPEKVGDCWMALPPCEEQLEITAFVEEFHLKLDTLIQQVRDTVGLLTERRFALISAAVTGKIDVRGWQPPASAPTHELEQEAV